jgi:protein TonB
VSQAARIPAVLFAALLVNVLLFSVIQYMVGNPRLRLTDVSDFEIANFIRMQEQSREVKSRRDPKAPEKPEADQQQAMRQLAQANTGGVEGLQVDVPEMDIDVGVDVGDIQIAREMAPLVRIPPEYPQRAAAKGVEGFVVLRFIITETGEVEAPEVMRAEPPGYFESAARRAVARWKYQPQIRDGKPTRVVAMARLRFELLDEPE